jgi:hypothetical protein
MAQSLLAKRMSEAVVADRFRAEFAVDRLNSVGLCDSLPMIITCFDDNDLYIENVTPFGWPNCRTLETDPCRLVVPLVEHLRRGSSNPVFSLGEHDRRPKSGVELIAPRHDGRSCKLPFLSSHFCPADSFPPTVSPGTVRPCRSPLLSSWRYCR